MNQIQLYTFSLVALVVAIMILDENVYVWCILRIRLIEINIKRYILMAKLHPKNPLTNYLMDRRIKKLVKELTKENGN